MITSSLSLLVTKVLYFDLIICFKETWAEYVARLEPHERQELEFILRKRRRDFDENISLDPKNAMRNKPPNWVRFWPIGQYV